MSGVGWKTNSGERSLSWLYLQNLRAFYNSSHCCEKLLSVNPKTKLYITLKFDNRIALCYKETTQRAQRQP